MDEEVEECNHDVGLFAPSNNMCTCHDLVTSFVSSLKLFAYILVLCHEGIPNITVQQERYVASS